MAVVMFFMTFELSIVLSAGNDSKEILFCCRGGSNVPSALWKREDVSYGFLRLDFQAP